MDIGKRIDLSKMNRLGVITIAQDRIDKYDAKIMQSDGKSLNEAFFERMKQCTYSANKKDCILSAIDSDNLILAHFDNNAIFLLSQNTVLSPQEFVEAMSRLMECSNEMNSMLSRKSNCLYSNFGMDNLNINFAKIELATEMPQSTIEHYVLAKKALKNSSSKMSRQSSDNIGLEYSCKKQTLTYNHSSQYGTSLVGYINEMIRTNPDMRLLMSNVVCYRKEIEIAQAMADTIGKHCGIGHFERGEFLPRDVFDRALSNFNNLVKNEKFLRTFEEEKNYRIYQRHENNSRYKVYEALQSVIKKFDESIDIDNLFQLEWHDGDPDMGVIAICTSLNRINKENMSGMMCLAPRGIPEVKEYFANVTSKAHQLSKEEKNKTEKIKNY